MTTQTYSTTKLLTSYFNQGDGKRGAQAWLKELRELSADEANELALGVAALLGIDPSQVILKEG